MFVVCCLLFVVVRPVLFIVCRYVLCVVRCVLGVGFCGSVLAAGGWLLFGFGRCV